MTPDLCPSPNATAAPASSSHQQFPFLAPPRRSTMAALISVCDFVLQTQEDLSSPTTSAFASHMGRCKATANSLEEVSRGPEGCTPRGWAGHPHCGPAGSAPGSGIAILFVTMS